MKGLRATEIVKYVNFARFWGELESKKLSLDNNLRIN